MAPETDHQQKSFDRRRLDDLLGSWYDSQMSSGLRKPASCEQAQKEGGTVFDIYPEMSSTKAVRVLLELKDILGFEPSKDVIKKGGYKTKDEFVKELSDRVAQAFQKHYQAKPPVGTTANKEAHRHAQI